MKKSGMSTFLMILAFLIGLSLLLYPTVSDYWNSLHSARAISSYSEQIANIDEDKYKDIIEAAQKYNDDCANRTNPYVKTEWQEENYYSTLDVSGSGTMGYIEIPSIDCSLPIYHGTSDKVLQSAVGHIEWSSLPIGGEGTHCVLSGHRGLPSAKLFTNLSQLIVGDIFIIRVLNEVLTYEVDQILTVEPNDTSSLLIEEGKDYCTLVTCTPYGINTHRLLVRGHRIENLAVSKTIHITADALQIEPVIVAPIVALPLLIVLMLMVVLGDKRNKHYRSRI